VGRRPHIPAHGPEGKVPRVVGEGVTCPNFEEVVWFGRTVSDPPAQSPGRLDQYDPAGRLRAAEEVEGSQGARGTAPDDGHVADHIAHGASLPIPCLSIGKARNEI
jgi:hypothetical protein